MLEDFTTSRLIVRRMQTGDAAELSAISDTPLVSQWMSFMEGGFPLERAKALIASQDTTNERFFSLRLPEGTLIGATGMVDHDDGLIEVGYWLGVDYHGKGYASEAVKAMLDQIASDPDLRTRQVMAEARPDNKASIRLLEKLGFYATGRPGPRPNRIEFLLRGSDARP